MRKFKPRQLKLCSVAGCRNLTIYRCCELHSGYGSMTAKQVELRKFLKSAAWLKLRLVKLQMSPHCEYCDEAGRGSMVPAIDVDHIKPRHSYPELSLALNNLKSACKRCHTLKTARGE
jgi:5-methylcytosine-specific restriction enzyme A